MLCFLSRNGINTCSSFLFQYRTPLNEYLGISCLKKYIHYLLYFIHNWYKQMDSFSHKHWPASVMSSMTLKDEVSQFPWQSNYTKTSLHHDHQRRLSSESKKQGFFFIFITFYYASFFLMLTVNAGIIHVTVGLTQERNSLESIYTFSHENKILLSYMTFHKYGIWQHFTQSFLGSCFNYWPLLFTKLMQFSL